MKPMRAMAETEVACSQAKTDLKRATVNKWPRHAGSDSEKMTATTTTISIYRTLDDIRAREISVGSQFLSDSEIGKAHFKNDGHNERPQLGQTNEHAGTIRSRLAEPMVSNGK